MNFQETKENQNVHENNSQSTLATRIRKLIYNLPLLKRVGCYILRHRSFRSELLDYALKQKSKGVKTFLNYHHHGWYEFFREQSRDFLQLQALVDELTLNFDMLSKEVTLRLFYTHFLTYLEGVVPFRGFQELLAPLFPIDAREQKRLIELDKSFKCNLVFPKRYEIPTIHIATQFCMCYFAPEIQKTLVGRDVIDGGGYSGDSAMVFTEFQPRNVYAFEPNPEMFPEMKKVIALNAENLGERINKIIPVPKALGKSQSTMKLYTQGIYDGSTSMLQHDKIKGRQKEYDVPVVSIDDYVRENSLDVGLIKLDVEGAESDVIEGALETIKTQKPLLIISVYHTPKDFFEIKPRLEKLDAGYNFMMRDPVPQSTFAEFCLLGYPK
jgi:FkbM family methyltransferase